MSDQFLSDVARKFGDDKASFLANRPPLDAVSTGSLALDYIIGPYCPGIPLGRLSQIYGGESAGKSLLCCQILAEAQNEGLATFLVDRERHYTASWFERFGGDASRVYDLQPATVEDCFDMVEAAAEHVRANYDGGIFVIDSLQSLPTVSQWEADTGTAEGLAATARFLSNRLGRYIEKIDRGRLGLITVGQIRENPAPFVKQIEREYTPGGNALMHYSVLRLKMYAQSRIFEKDEDTGEEFGVGFTTSVETHKNDVGGMAPYKSIEIDFRDGSGSDDTRALFQIAKNLGLLERSGSWYNVPSVDDKFQGQSNWQDFVADHPELIEDIKASMFDPEMVLRHEAEDVGGELNGI